MAKAKSYFGSDHLTSIEPIVGNNPAEQLQNQLLKAIDNMEHGFKKIGRHFGEDFAQELAEQVRKALMISSIFGKLDMIVEIHEGSDANFDNGSQSIN